MTLSNEQLIEILEQFGGRATPLTADIAGVLAKFTRGRATHTALYAAMRERRLEHDRSWTMEAEATIRCHLQRHSQYHPHYNKKWADVFRRYANGVWELRPEVREKIKEAS